MNQKHLAKTITPMPTKPEPLSDEALDAEIKKVFEQFAYNERMLYKDAVKKIHEVFSPKLTALQKRVQEENKQYQYALAQQTILIESLQKENEELKQTLKSLNVPIK